MSENNKKVIFFSLIGIFILFSLVYNTVKKRGLYENFMTTKGTVIDFTYSNHNYTLKYEYVVNGITYTNTESTDYFKCSDGTPGCKGRKFIIEYSSKNPENSNIDLREFNNEKLISPSF